MNRAAAIVRVGEVAFDRGDGAIGASLQQVAANRWQIGGEAGEQFARCVEPLPHQCCQKAQQHRLVLEQSAKSARLHAGDELLIRAGAVTARLGEAFVEGRSGKVGQLAEEAVRKAGTRAFGELDGGRLIDPGPKPLLCLCDERKEEPFERHRFTP